MFRIWKSAREIQVGCNCSKLIVLEQSLEVKTLCINQSLEVSILLHEHEVCLSCICGKHTFRLNISTSSFGISMEIDSSQSDDFLRNAESLTHIGGESLDASSAQVHVLNRGGPAWN